MPVEANQQISLECGVEASTSEKGDSAGASKAGEPARRVVSGMLV